MIGGSASVIDIETIDSEDPAFAPVIEAFNSYGTWALPIITLYDKIVCFGNTEPNHIAGALEQALTGVEGSTH